MCIRDSQEAAPGVVCRMFCITGGCTLGATGLEDFLPLHELHKVHDFNGCFDPQHDLQLIAEAKRGFIEALHQQNCPLSVAPERFSH